MTSQTDWEGDDFGGGRRDERAEIGDYFVWVWPVEDSSEWLAEGRFAAYDGPPTEIGVFSNKRAAKKAAVEWAMAQEMEDEEDIEVAAEQAIEVDEKAFEEELLDDD